MKTTLDSPTATSPRAPGEDAPHITHALRALARFTYPGLEPRHPGDLATGYNRTREHLHLPARGGFEALLVLAARGYAMRVGRKGWSITKKGREFARALFGQAALAREEMEDDVPPAYARRRLVEGAADVLAPALAEATNACPTCGGLDVRPAMRLPPGCFSCLACGAVWRSRGSK
jgi:hypothetical protein